MRVTFGKKCSNGIVAFVHFVASIASPLTPTFVVYVELLAFAPPPSGTCAAEKACGTPTISSLLLKVAGSATFLMCAPFV
jgi:hypothetical protein